MSSRSPTSRRCHKNFIAQSLVYGTIPSLRTFKEAAMRSTPVILAAALVFGAGVPSFAAGGGGGGSDQPAAVTKPVDPSFAQAKAMIEAKNYAAAIPLLKQVVAKNPRDADAYVLMGYATRKS